MTPYSLEQRGTDESAGCLLVATGELDLTNADELERRVRELAGGSSIVALDLNAITFLDSAALHALFRLARTFREEGVAFGVALDSGAAVARAVAIAGLPAVTFVRPTADEVLAGLAG